MSLELYLFLGFRHLMHCPCLLFPMFGLLFIRLIWPFNFGGRFLLWRKRNAWTLFSRRFVHHLLSNVHMYEYVHSSVDCEKEANLNFTRLQL